MFGQTSGRAGLEAAKYTEKPRLSRPCDDRLSFVGQSQVSTLHHECTLKKVLTVPGGQPVIYAFGDSSSFHFCFERKR